MSYRSPDVKLPAHRAGLPGKVFLLYIVPLDPSHKAGLAGHVPVNVAGILFIPLISDCIIEI
ncbi:MAG: hypothetical protein EHM85_15170 [Desulfobacteraceae bacterium]|nr:MAG: hypothetical protein EHM85_15170 [Desulfobacteraceae bacterium]